MLSSVEHGKSFITSRHGLFSHYWNHVRYQDSSVHYQYIESDMATETWLQKDVLKGGPKRGLPPSFSNQFSIYLSSN